MLPLAAVAALPPRIAVEAFFANPAFAYLALSDDGTKLAYLQSRGDLRVAVVQPAEGDHAVAVAKFDDPATRPSRLLWANDRRILISAHARDPKAVGMRNRYTRLFGVDSDGKNFAWLGKDWPVYGSDYRQSTSQDALVHLTPNEPKTILLEYWSMKEDSPQVMRMDVDTGHLTLAQKREHKIYDWNADRDGAIRAGTTTYGSTYQIWARVDATRNLELVAEHEELDADGIHFVAFHSEPDKIYVSSLKDGRTALFEFDLETRSLGDLVEAHPEVDVAGAEYFGLNRTAVGVRYTDDRRRVRYFDADTEVEYGQLRKTLDSELERSVDVATISSSADGMRQVIMASSDRQPPLYYLYSRKLRRIQPLFAAYPNVPRDALAATQRVTFRARDGLSIPAYLTLPAGVEARALPAVALIHGGPWSRDSIEWDPEVQLLANRGFAVLQVNYRGSAGFGRSFRDTGNREWGQKMQDDVTDGVQWLISQGVADADRVAIMGTSYGGYAALIGLVRTPELYRAGVAYAPVTDIENMLADEGWFGRSEQFDRKYIGGEPGDAPRLRENSPLRRAAEIKAPLLLGHGVDDQRVHVRQSQDMAAALKAVDANYEYLEFPDEIHGFALETNRIRWYQRVVEFLEENLAPRGTATGH
jgi:dipeptidyl aminopeptidase/acylaminoacyl peptidase